MNWVEAVARHTAHGVGHVLVTVATVEGSAPREASAKMVVTADQTDDSIGGGNLEFQAIARARDMLINGRASATLHTFSLGADLTQCCGGRVTVLFECFPGGGLSVALFGAGHVGRALVHILSELPCRVRWMDSRPDMFPPEVASHITPIPMDNPYAAVEACPADTCYLIMTHSHDIDFELCEAILGRSDARYCGLIGSRSKGARFHSRLRKKGFTDAERARLTSPIGLAAVPGKRPMEVAVAVAAQLLQLHHPSQPSQPSQTPAPPRAAAR